MKKIGIIISFWIVLSLPVWSFAQSGPPLAEPGASPVVRQPRVAPPYVARHFTLTITLNKTTSLLFPATITSVDRGSRDILVQKTKGTENVLQLKAGKMNFAETNLTVITADGQLRCFLVNYSPDTPELVFDFRNSLQSSKSMTKGEAVGYLPPVLLAGGPMSEETIGRSARKIIDLPRTMHGIRDRQQKILFLVKGIYVQEKALFFQLQLKNASNLAYDTGFLRFYFRDRRQAKRTAVQEVEVKPILSYGIPSRIEGGNEQSWVVVFDQFTIPVGQQLVMEMQEKSGAITVGARHTTLKVSSRQLLNAWLLD